MSFEGYSFNIVKQRASPTKVQLDSGHFVEKQDYVYYQAPNEDASGPGEWGMVKCSDYHGEHFVYLDPMYHEDPKQIDPNTGQTGRGHWFAMCTCGSPAVIVGTEEAQREISDYVGTLLVCYIYHSTLVEDGFGTHADQQGRRRWT